MTGVLVAGGNCANTGSPVTPAQIRRNENNLFTKGLQYSELVGKVQAQNVDHVIKPRLTGGFLNELIGNTAGKFFGDLSPEVYSRAELVKIGGLIVSL